jgi:hypothetical protein
MRSSRPSSAGAAAAIILTCISCCAVGEEKVSFIRIQYLISEVMGPPEALTILSDGTARFESYSNLLSSGRDPVGLFETRFNASQLAALSSAIDDPPFENIPDRRAAADGYRSIQVTRQSGTSERRADHRMAVDPAMKKLIGRLDRLADEVKSHPVRILLLRAGSVHTDGDGFLEAVLTFSNPGTQALRMVNPAYPGGAVLSVRTQPGIPDSQLKSTDIAEAKAFEVHQAGAATETPEALVQLEAGGSLSFRAKFALGRKPGAPSLARFSYQQTAQEWNGKPVLAAELYSPNTPIQ